MPKSSALTETDLKILNALGPVRASDGSGENQFVYWSPELTSATGLDFISMERALKDLKKRRLVAQDGRGKFAFFWITKEGAQARAMTN